MNFDYKIIYLLTLATLLNSCGSLDEVREEYSAKSELDFERSPKSRKDRTTPLRQLPQVSQSDALQPIDLKYPVVFHHGFMGGTKMGMNMEVKQILEARGVHVYRTEVSPANAIAYRAQQLAAQIDKILAESKADKVNIIAHSMGGLDARYLISSLNYDDRVASLTTIATPHRGTPLADLVTDRGGNSVVLNIFVTLLSKGINSNSNLDNNNLNAALQDLRTDFMENTFNPQNPDREGVYYQSYAGVSRPDSKDRLTLLLFASHRIITKSHGPNDGVVPMSSAQWTNYRGALPADHIDLSGFKDLSQTAIDYEAIVQKIVTDLAKKGL